MAAKITAVQDLTPGNVLADAVISVDGKILLAQDVLLTPRHIALLNSWDVQKVFIKTDQEETAPLSQETKAQNIDHQSIQEYNHLITDTEKTFDIIKRRKRIPAVHLQDTAGSIQSFITNHGLTAINYLLASNSRLADLITQHSITVASFAGIIARQLRWSEDDVKGVALAGLLHDVGSLITEKNDQAADAFHIVETAMLLKNTPNLTNDVILGIVQHREHIDGSGIPTKASGADIHPYAKIIAVCDTFHRHSLSSEYANPFPALKILADEMFGKLDPFICQAFISRVMDGLMNNTILLSDGQEAEIVYFHPSGSYLPVIKTTSDQIIDLSKNRNMLIHRVISLDDTSQSLKDFQ